VVDVVFQKTRRSTAVSLGPNPSWHQELQLPFKYVHLCSLPLPLLLADARSPRRPTNEDYSASGLQAVRDSIFITVYDEVEMDMSDAEGAGAPADADAGASREVRKRVDRHLLGTVEIPFTTVYLNGARARCS
jgi:coiled-coil and C2 domain-containing protein 2A